MPDLKRANRKLLRDFGVRLWRRDDLDRHRAVRRMLGSLVVDCVFEGLPGPVRVVPGDIQDEVGRGRHRSATRVPGRVATGRRMSTPGLTYAALTPVGQRTLSQGRGGLSGYAAGRLHAQRAVGRSGNGRGRGKGLRIFVRDFLRAPKCVSGECCGAAHRACVSGECCGRFLANVKQTKMPSPRNDCALAEGCGCF